MVMGDQKNPEFVVSGSLDSTGAFATTPSQDKVAAAQTISAVNANPTGPTAATANSTATIDVSGRTTLEIAVTAAGGGTPLAVYASSDNLNWTLVGGTPLTQQSTGLAAPNSMSGTGLWTMNVADLGFVRVSSIAGFTGSATVILSASSTVAIVSLDNPQLPVYPVAPATQWQAAVTDIVNTSTPVKAAAGAGLRNYITDLTISNSSVAAVLVQLLDGVTVLWQAIVPAGGTIDTDFTVPLKGSVATAVNVQAAAPTTTLYVNAVGYTAP